MRQIIALLYFSKNKPWTQSCSKIIPHLNLANKKSVSIPMTALSNPTTSQSSVSETSTSTPLNLMKKILWNSKMVKLTAPNSTFSNPCTGKFNPKKTTASTMISMHVWRESMAKSLADTKPCKIDWANSSSQTQTSIKAKGTTKESNLITATLLPMPSQTQL